MYTQTFTYHPTVGRFLELRDVVLRRAAQLQEMGVRASVAVWSEVFPAVRLSQDFDNLGELEDARNANPEATRAFIAQSDDLISKPASPRLLDIISHTGPADQPARWFHELTVTPGIGKAADLRVLMSERDRSLEAQGRSTVLASQVAPGDYGLLVRAFLYPSLEALDEQRRRNVSSPDEREHIKREQALIGRLAQSEIWEALPLD